MFCILSFIILAILGIFSATHRQLAKEALDCVLRRVTLRPCDTGFSEKMRGRIVGKLMDRSLVLARLFNKHFEMLSWIFFILMVASTVWFARGVWNFYFYGNCSGLEVAGFCPFDPTGEAGKVTQIGGEAGVCPAGSHDEKSLTLGALDPTDFPQKLNDQSENEIVFIGCYSCEYTRKTYPIVKKLAEKRKVNFTFVHFPVKGNTEYLSKYDYCANKLDPEKFWRLNDLLFATDPFELSNPETIDRLVGEAGYDVEAVKACVASPETEQTVAERIADIQSTGIYGTPTVFVNGTAAVGPKPERVYRNLLK